MDLNNKLFEAQRNYLAFKERVILDLCRKHGLRDYQDMRHRGYDIQSEVQTIPNENGMTTKETFTVYRMQKIDQVTFELTGEIIIK